MKVVSFIPIKLNNQRLPGKNLLDLAGRPVCDYLFNTVAGIDEIDEKYKPEEIGGVLFEYFVIPPQSPQKGE